MNIFIINIPNNPRLVISTPQNASFIDLPSYFNYIILKNKIYFYTLLMLFILINYNNLFYCTKYHNLVYLLNFLDLDILQHNHDNTHNLYILILLILLNVSDI